MNDNDNVLASSRPDGSSHYDKIHIYYGLGKGKTTAAFGLCLRALGAGLKVAVLQFDKVSERINEAVALFPFKHNGNLKHIIVGKNRVVTDKCFRFKNKDEDFEEAKRGLKIARELIAGKHDVVILDEILASVMCGLIEKKDVMELLDFYDEHRTCELILTGHQIWDELKERVDLITEIRKEKHYFDTGLGARKGIDY